MAIHTLPARLDTPAAAPLCRVLLDLVAGGETLIVDGAEVAQIGQACLQVLASAHRTAAARGLPFEIERPSAALMESCTIAGLDHLARKS